MKKKSIRPAAAALLATGLLAGAAAAQAQSNVTIYGLLDVPVEYLRTSGGNHEHWTRMPNLTGSLPSRIGFRGQEDLGGGLKAVFTLETGLGLDTGSLNQGGRGFGRQAFVGLQGTWGTFSLGRQYSMLFWSLLDSDIIGPSLYGSGSLDNYLPNSRFDNAIAYRGTFGGFTAGASYSFGRDTVNAGPSPSGTNCAGESSTDRKTCRAWSAMVKYDTANWGAAVAGDEQRGGPGAFAGLVRSDMTDRRLTVNGWARFGALKLGAGVIARRNEALVATPRSNLAYLQAAYALTPVFTLDGALMKLDYRHSANQATLATIRGTYNLSKRTAVYATAGHISNDGTLALSVSGAAAGGLPPAGGSQNGIAMGVRHSF